MRDDSIFVRTRAPHRLNYNAAIDGLRGVAVLSVVAYHAGLPVSAGFVGVDVFFVISGFLITQLLHDELQATGRIGFAGFYARRARRILPALVTVVVSTLGLSALLLRPSSFAGVAQSAAAASAFVANLFFQSRTGGYWSEDATSMPLLHLWSLSIEEQFYLLWPVVLIASGRRAIPVLACIAVHRWGLPSGGYGGSRRQRSIRCPRGRGSWRWGAWSHCAQSGCPKEQHGPA